MNEFFDGLTFFAILTWGFCFAAAAILLIGWLSMKIMTWVTDQRIRMDEHRPRMAMAKAELDRYQLDSGHIVVQPSQLHVPRAALMDTIEAQFALAAAQVDARRTHAPAPHIIHYAPQQTYPNDVPSASVVQPEGLLQPPSDFWALFHSDKLPENGFLLGYSREDNQPVTADWRKLYSALIGGQSGSGKSTLIRSILAQSALQGGQFVVIDPHAGSGAESLAESLQPLHKRMLCAPAVTDDQIRDALAFVAHHGRHRLRGEDKDKTPLILVVDELTGLLVRVGVADELMNTLGLIAQETRKVGVYALAIGQNFHSDIMSTSVRNSFASAISCRARSNVAKVMSGSHEFGKLAAKLNVGQAVWLSPQGEMARLAIPNITQHHLELVARQIEGLAILPEVEHGSDRSAKVVPDLVPGQPEKADWEPVRNPRAARVAQMFSEGYGVDEVIRQAWGVEGRGRTYQDAKAELYAMIAASMRGKA